jgi:hypothetical protein
MARTPQFGGVEVVAAQRVLTNASLIPFDSGLRVGVVITASPSRSAWTTVSNAV